MTETSETAPHTLTPGVYRLLVDKSTVRMTVGGVAGRISAEVPIQTGHFVVDKHGRIAEVETVLDARGLSTGGQVVRHALMGRSGLDVARFATVTFASTAVLSDGPSLVIEGLLTMRGVSHAAQFRGEIVRAAGRRIVVKLEATVDRTRYGLTVGRPLYAKAATVRIRASALRETRP